MRSPKRPNYILQLLFLVLVVAALAFVVSNQLALFFLMLLLLFLVLLVWGLFDGGDEERSEERKSLSLPEEEAGETPKLEYPLEAFYIQDELIIRGPETAVNAIVDRFSDIIEIEPLQTIAFRNLDDRLRECIGSCSSFSFDDFVINLYRYTGTEEDVAAAIQAINNALGRGSDVQAEPNWLSGYPWEPTGSPWEPTGSPWEPTGSSASGEKSAPPDQFMRQWAFEKINLNTLSHRRMGSRVRIGVFDTSPFGGSETLPPNVTLDNSYLLPQEENAEIDLSSHGYFAAGLAGAVAQQAQIEMIRVLNKNNIGNLYSLLMAIYDFTVRNSKFNSSDRDLLGAVINMSLGIRILPEDAGKPLPFEVQSLRILMQLARCAGIVVVAAAGNDSANLVEPEAANLPANWSEVIGVGASTQADGRSCFSNRGNIAAPGGDGGSSEDGSSNCVPANHTCSDASCEYSVIGPVLKKPDNTGFAYWSGTSFATPMVAGLAACVIEMGQGKLSPDEVREIIECGADNIPALEVGGMRINVAKTLNLDAGCWDKYRERLDDDGYESEEQMAA